MISNRRPSGWGGAALRLVAALALAAPVVSACTAQLADLPVVGEPPGMPARPASPPPFPAVHDLPPARDTKPMTEDEAKKLEADLQVARDRQVAQAAAAATAKSAAAAKKKKTPPAAVSQEAPPARNP